MGGGRIDRREIAMFAVSLRSLLGDSDADPPLGPYFFRWFDRLQLRPLRRLRDGPTSPAGWCLAE